MKRRAGAPPPSTKAAVGLCATCCHAHEIRTVRGSVFWRCRHWETDARYPRYPRLPVLDCPGHEPIS